MRIIRGAVVSLTYELRDCDGRPLDGPGAELEYLHGYGGIFPKVEQALEGKRVGHEMKLTLDPEDAFGEYDAELLRVEPRERFPATLELGMRFEGVPGERRGQPPRGQDSTEDALIYTVTDIADDRVVVDANHPLAGERLWFRCKVTGVRRATPEETEHGHVHDVGVSAADSPPRDEGRS
jgi:FKBP-type peptidyl-prolyl cis-trans isomerase SlyD